jgi:hypothetical protein
VRKFYVLGMIAAACLGVAAQAWAGTDVGSLLEKGPNFFQGGVNREYLLDRDYTQVGSSGFQKKGQIDVGDSFRGLFNLGFLNSGSSNLGGLTPNDELTGIFQVMVIAKTFNPPTLANPSGTFDLLFGPDPSFTAPGFGAIPGLVAALYDGSGGTKNYAEDFNDPLPAAKPPADTDNNKGNGPTDDGTSGPRTVAPKSTDVSVGPYAIEEGFVNTAKDGTPLLALGFTAAPTVPPALGNGEGIGCLGAPFDNVLPFFGLPSGSNTVHCNLDLNVLAYGAAFPSTLPIARVQPSVLAPGKLVDIAIREDLGGVKNLDTPFEASSLLGGNFDTAPVPEPGTLLLFGSCLLGLGIVLYRKQ